MLATHVPKALALISKKRPRPSFPRQDFKEQVLRRVGRHAFASRNIATRTSNVIEMEKTEKPSENWRNHPELRTTIPFKTWIVPVDGKAIQTILSSKQLQEYFATRHELVQEMHHRLKIVRDLQPGSSKSKKSLLVLPETPEISELPEDVRELLQHAEVLEGDEYPVSFGYKDFTASYILSKVLPVDIHPPTTAFETIGHVAHLNLPENHLPYKKVIGEVLLETLPLIETVIDKVGEVSGPYRTYNHDLLAGRDSTEVQLVESGVKLQFDISEVYWCSRLSEERKRLMNAEFKPNQVIADPFCGVGAQCILAASQLNCTIWANDWNPKAVDYFRENSISNGVQIERLVCGDAYDFLMGMGLRKDDDDPDFDEPMRLPDHVVMNFPLKGPEFLGALRWWPTSQSNGHDDGIQVPRVHVYTFARADAETERDVKDVAIDIVATHLLGRPVTHIRQELDDEFHCRVHVHLVRDVAPGKVVVCVSFSATQKLLRYMQGDF